MVKRVYANEIEDGPERLTDGFTYLACSIHVIGCLIGGTKNDGLLFENPHGKEEFQI